MKIGVFQLSDKIYANTLSSAIESVSEYCLKHKIDHYPLEGALSEAGDCHINYQKPLLLLKYIEKYDYVVWLDTDVIVSDERKTFNEIIEKYRRDIYFCSDPGFWRLNSGVLIFKNCEQSKWVLHKWWDSRLIGRDRHWRDGGPQGQDQRRLISIIEGRLPKGDQNRKALDPKLMNCHPRGYEDGVFLVHCMGYMIEDTAQLAEIRNESDSFNAFRDLIPTQQVRQKMYQQDKIKNAWEPANMIDVLNLYKTIKSDPEKLNQFEKQKKWWENRSQINTEEDPWKNYIIQD